MILLVIESVLCIVAALYVGEFRESVLLLGAITVAATGGILSIMSKALYQDTRDAVEATRTLWQEYTAEGENYGKAKLVKPTDLRRPAVHYYESVEEVASEAANIIDKARAERNERHRYVTFYGSAVMGIADPLKEHAGYFAEDDDDDEKKQNPHQLYSATVEAVASDLVPMRRYVCLLRNEELGKRSRAVQREYREWIDMQLLQLRRNEHYRITHSLRAPIWGCGIARIITHHAVMEITGRGEAATVVTDPQAAETIRQAARCTMLGDDLAVNDPYHYSSTTAWRHLKGIWKDLAEFERDFVEPARKAHNASREHFG